MVARFSAQLFRGSVAQDFRGGIGQCRSAGVHCGHAETKNFYQSVPLDHDFCRLEGSMNDSVSLGMVESLANLADDVLQIPDREAFVPRERGRYRISLNVLRRGKKKIRIIAYAVEGGNVVAAERFRAF